MQHNFSDSWISAYSLEQNWRHCLRLSSQCVPRLNNTVLVPIFINAPLYSCTFISNVAAMSLCFSPGAVPGQSVGWTAEGPRVVPL